MQVKDALASAGLERLDAEVLLAHILSNDRAWLLAHADDELSSEDSVQFNACSDRRRRGEPVAYIIGQKEFYGRTFHVRPGVLIPRPATELLVTSALDMLDGTWSGGVRDADTGIVIAGKIFQPLNDVKAIVDVGTGSGCIAITLALERPDLHIIATDISEEALKIAQENAELHGVADRIEFRKGNLLEPVMNVQKPLLLVSNPPYVADEKLLATDVQANEPINALMGGGADGADILRKIVSEAQGNLMCRAIIIECLETQLNILTEA